MFLTKKIILCIQHTLHLHQHPRLSVPSKTVSLSPGLLLLTLEEPVFWDTTLRNARRAATYGALSIHPMR